MKFESIILKIKRLKSELTGIRWSNSWLSESDYLKALELEFNATNKRALDYAIFKFRAQVYDLNTLQLLKLQTISIPIMIREILMCFKTLKKPTNTKVYDAVCFYDLRIIPCHILQKKSIILLKEEKYLSFKDLVFLLEIFFLTNFNFYITSASIYRIAQLAYAIKYFRISEAYVNMEYSVAGPICQIYCQRNNIKLKNFMHGEKIATSRDSFIIFDEYIVWNEHYKNLASSLIAKTKFVINNPWLEFKKNKKETEIDNKSKRVLYILKGIECNKEIECISKHLNLFMRKGYFPTIKYHPRNSIQSKSKFHNYQTYESDELNLNTLDSFTFIISQYSTVLFQAHTLGHKILVDDLSNPILFSILKSRSYYFSQSKFENLLLSNNIKNI